MATVPGGPCSDELEKWKEAGAQADPPISADRVEELVCVPRPPPALVRRIAEAADGFRTGKDIFFVVDPGEGGTGGRVGVFHDRTDALVAADGTEGARAFGPFRTPRDRRPDGNEIPESAIRKVTVEYADGSTREVCVRPEDETPDRPAVDALFFSISAFDKFVVPYYSLVQGARQAQERRKDFLERWGRAEDPVYMWCHLPCSEECS